VANTTKQEANVKETTEADVTFFIKLLGMTIEELLSCVETEPELSELRADMIRARIADELEKRCPQVFGVNAMKKYFAEAETPEQRPATRAWFLGELNAALERGKQ
jgi:hypothetical protein